MLSIIGGHVLNLKIGNLKFGSLLKTHQITKLKTSPMFPRYTAFYHLCHPSPTKFALDLASPPGPIPSFQYYILKSKQGLGNKDH